MATEEPRRTRNIFSVFSVLPWLLALENAAMPRLSGIVAFMSFTGSSAIYLIDIKLKSSRMSVFVQEVSFVKMTVREASKLFNVSEKTIYRWIEQKSLPAYRINKQFRFNQTELLEWAAAGRTSFSPALLSEPESGSAPLPDLVQALAAGGVHYRVAGNDRDSVLRSVVELLRLPDHVDREFLLEVLLAREALGSTGIGDGIAIPHARNPIVLNVERPTITLCFPENPVDFAALDGLPVTVLFTLISPTVRAHLHLLSRLAFCLNDRGFRDVLRRQESRNEIFEEARRAVQGLT